MPNDEQRTGPRKIRHAESDDLIEGHGFVIRRKKQPGIGWSELTIESLAMKAEHFLSIYDALPHL